MGRSFTCLLLGEELLMVHCGEHLLQRGHTIVGVVTSSRQGQQWAAAKSFRMLARDEYLGMLRESGVDLLCSITYPAIIGVDAIACARVAAFNYHDGPLPRYAGMNGSAWALHNGEKAHAVCWHELAAGLDEGSIYVRKDVTFDAAETSASLNMKNSALAFAGFKELLASIEAGALAGVPQRTDIERTVFSRHDRPSALATIDWSAPASEIDHLVRACDFGPFVNRFGLAKLVHRGKAVVVREARPSTASSSPAGVVLRAGASLSISCGRGALDVERVTALGGAELTIPDACALLGLDVGVRIVDDGRAARVAQTRKVAEAEPFFVKRLAQLEPTTLPDVMTQPGAPSAVRVDVPARIDVASARSDTVVAAAFGALIASLRSVSRIEIATTDPGTADAASTCLFGPNPLGLELRDDDTFTSLALRVEADRRALEQRTGWLLDLVARTPELASSTQLVAGSVSPVGVAWRGASAPPNVRLALVAGEHGVELIDHGTGHAAVFAPLLSAFLRNVLEAPSRPLSSVPLVSAEDARRVVEAFNETTRAYPSALRIHDLFERQVRVRPDAVALVCADATMTFAQLDERANQIARVLQARGAGPGEFVAVCAERGMVLVAALLGVAKSGAAFVPIDDRFPEDRAAFMADDAHASFVLATSSTAARFAGRDVVLLDGPVVDSAASNAVPCASTASDVCYAIYTSGSTGKPKGVVLTHRAVVNTLDWVNRTMAVGSADRLLFVTSPSFDLSVYDVFGALGAGACVEIATAAELADPAVMVAKLTRAGVTIWDSAPPALSRLVPFFPAMAPSSTLRTVMLSGDWIPLSLPDDVRRVFSSVAVHSLGGATEAAICSNHFAIDAVQPSWRSIPYGRPIQNARYLILDRHLRAMPVGVAGDLYIGGTVLARGYLDRPELTAERFIADPFHPGERLYKTGDLARFWDDGTMEFLGRADFQVKIRGYRVELGEVEAALASEPGVREAVCVARTDPSGTKILVGYCTAKAGATIDAAALQSALRARMPNYLVPSIVVVLDQLPLSSSGKVDRNALPTRGEHGRARTVQMPRTQLERDLVELWRELLGVPTVGVDESFFDLGGHSLLAVALVARIKKQLGRDLPIATLIERTTIERIASWLEGGSGPEESPHQLLVSVRRPRHSTGKAPLFLVAGQGGHVFIFPRIMSQFDDQRAVYALQHLGVERGEPTRSVADSARAFLDDVLSVAPEGPLVLGGYSLGALYALEVAFMLEDRGIRVPTLISFDGWAPGFPKSLPLVKRRIQQMKFFIREPYDKKVQYLTQRVRANRNRLLRKLGLERLAMEREAAALRHLGADDEARRIDRASEATAYAAQRYRTNRVFHGDLILFKATVPTEVPGMDVTDPTYNWAPHIQGRIFCENLEGDHERAFSGSNLARLHDVLRRIAADGRVESDR